MAILRDYREKHDFFLGSSVNSYPTIRVQVSETPPIIPLFEEIINWQDVFANWLNNRSWTYWATFTTRYTLTMKSARRCMEGLMHRSASGLVGGVKLVKANFWACEPYDVKDGQHVHALVETCPNASINDLVKAWQVVSGNPRLLKSSWNRVHVQPYYPSKGAHYYC
jgi:hypothetical protein